MNNSKRNIDEVFNKVKDIYGDNLSNIRYSLEKAGFSRFDIDKKLEQLAAEKSKDENNAQYKELMLENAGRGQVINRRINNNQVLE